MTFSRALQEQYAFEEKIATYNQEVLNEDGKNTN